MSGILLQGEPGSEVVGRVLAGSVISAVNVSEVWQKLIAHGLDPAPLIGGLQALGLGVAAFDGPDAEATGRLWPTTRTHGLSLADRACLALAMRLGRPVVTADRAWTGVGVGVEILQLR